MCAAYDPNFYYPVKEFQSDRVKLVPFHPELNGKAFYDASALYPEVYDWIPFGPFPTIEGFLDYIEGRIHRDPALTLFVVYNKSVENETDQIAGLIGFLNTVPAYLSTEIGFVFTLPPFQRTHVTTHAVGLLLAWCFDELKLRRVQWQANALNEKSVSAAQKMGFILEGIIRWQRLLPPEKSERGLKPREDDPKPEYYGRNSALLSVCWDDWEDGVRQQVQERMARRK
ncbi:uncharacterized protein PHACADRAFT_103896 [Phanerochaete carnosa HHB-10118-sp]|uniref:N-acetyltransferase domain-containing protein n=1 Tax=Phanerochaete carnosa (strain HHB-10118-sp) TaxID=650164 RepID=K5VIH8_PHACS|nr:uncharacterized protein PHACADRAFT_103896 [Phanerochaete carnosa HHB-10118-sp]EKM51083.1 hypothetical protein PHACADRAFT_103896 [Phanerochaete carnosa HHB-10118-sp]